MEWYIAANGYLLSVYLNGLGNAIVRWQAVYKIQSVVDYINKWITFIAVIANVLTCVVGIKFLIFKS